MFLRDSEKIFPRFENRCVLFQRLQTGKGFSACYQDLLFFQEQIQGPENASIARFQGICCYRIRSKTQGISVFFVEILLSNSLKTGFNRMGNWIAVRYTVPAFPSEIIPFSAR